MHFGKQILRFIFKPQCVKCGKFGGWLCPDCKNKLIGSLPECYSCRKISPDFATHQSCLSASTPFSKVIVCWRYNEIGKNLIAKFKYSYVFQMSETLADLIASSSGFSKLIKELSPDLDQAVFTIIPLHIRRQNQRGFNQCDLLANQILASIQLTDLQYVPNLLIRRANNEHQAHLDRFQRKSNIKDAFSINKSALLQLQLNSRGKNAKQNEAQNRFAFESFKLQKRHRQLPDNKNARNKIQTNFGLKPKKPQAKTASHLLQQKQNPKTPQSPSVTKIVVFDDILTTGSTMNEAGRVLRKTFPQATLIGFCLFRGGRGN
ncbi:hypothetical protein GF357_01180 [Candidatus Dojkabacteria bacterium]|nr:hypothetical protein [Candidatus Dojkabacteria bacterium]